MNILCRGSKEHKCPETIGKMVLRSQKPRGLATGSLPRKGRAAPAHSGIPDLIPSAEEADEAREWHN